MCGPFDNCIHMSLSFLLFPYHMCKTNATKPRTNNSSLSLPAQTSIAHARHSLDSHSHTDGSRSSHSLTKRTLACVASPAHSDRTPKSLRAATEYRRVASRQAQHNPGANQNSWLGPSSTQHDQQTNTVSFTL